MKKSSLACMLASTMLLISEHASAALTTIGDITSAPVVQGDSILIHCSNADVRVKLCGHDVVKVWCDQTKAFTRTDPKWYGTGSFAVVTEKLGSPSSVTAADKGTYYEIVTDALSIQCRKSPFRIDFYDKSNNLICADNDANGMGWDDGTKEVRCWKKKQAGENYFGLGQAMKGLNKTGHSVTNWNTDMAGGNGAWASELNLNCGNDGNYYTSNPFYVSTKGYGIFFDNTSMTRFDMGKENSQYVYFGTKSPAAVGTMIYYFIYGPSLKKVVTRYTDLTGKSFFPPRWALGCMQSHWGYHQSDIESVSGKYRDKKIPCDVMIADIDWLACKCAPIGWSGNFSNPKKMIENLHNNGFKFLLISDPNISNNESSCSQAYSEGKTKKCYARNGSGDVSVVGWPWGGSSGLIDFFNEDAWKWWGKLHYPRMDEGVDGWWIDMNEPAKYNTDMHFYRSTNDHLGDIKELHNVFGHANSRADYLWMRDYFDNVAKNNKRPFLLSRAGYLGQQKYLTTWSGDTYKEFSWLGNQVYQAMSTGICGFPLFAHDVGGFWNSDKNNETLQSRWIEFGAFSPICRFHYHGSANEPWTSGANAESIARKYIQLRYRLKPYLYSELAKSVIFGTGLPLCRALVLEYQNDGETYDQGSEYLFGPNLLVAPVITSGTSRSVYLPKDTWIDYWDGTVHSGPETISSYPAPLDKLPIFVRAGAIIPMYPLMNYEGEKSIDTLTFDVYPGGTSNDTLYEDQGETHEFQTGKYATTRLSLSGSITGGPVNFSVGAAKGTYTGMPSTRTCFVVIHYQKKPDSVFLNQQKLGEVSDTAALSQAASGWCYLAGDRKGTVRIKTTPVPASTPFAVAINAPATGVVIQGMAAEDTYDIASAMNGIRIRFFSAGSHSVGIYTLSGKQVFSFSGKGPAERRFVTGDCGRGLYLAKIRTEGVTLFKRIVTK